MKKQIREILSKYRQNKGYTMEHVEHELLNLFSVRNSALIDYIENNAEIAMPIDEMFNEDGTHITKKKYGHVLLKYLVKELRKHYC